MNMKLGLGTVQLGMPYGIANQLGQPSRQEAINMLNFARDNGIELLDTATGYGESETIIGEYFASYSNSKENISPMKVVTKISLISEVIKYTAEEMYQLLKGRLKESLTRLNMDVVDYCLLHSPINLYSHDMKVVQALKNLKEDGFIRKIGASVYTPDQVKQFLNINGLDIIQVPLNIFDHRLISLGYLNMLREKGIEVHARSVFLQGLLMLPADGVPHSLSEVKRPLELLKNLAVKIKLTPAQLALLFVRDLKEIGRVIVGCESLEQLKDNINTMKMPKIDSYIKAEISKSFVNIPEYILDPSKWRR